MKKFILITQSPLERVTKVIEGFPTVRHRDSLEGCKAPSGCKYVEDLPRPTEAPEDGYRWTRKLYLMNYGWEQVALPPESLVPHSVSMAQFREELSNPAYNVDSVSLRLIVQQAVEASGIVMIDWWDTAGTVERENAKVLAMASALSIDSDTLDAIFIGAASN